MVEQWTENPCVGGSIPSLSTSNLAVLVAGKELCEKRGCPKWDGPFLFLLAASPPHTYGGGRTLTPCLEKARGTVSASGAAYHAANIVFKIFARYTPRMILKPKTTEPARMSVLTVLKDLAETVLTLSQGRMTKPEQESGGCNAPALTDRLASPDMPRLSCFHVSPNV